MLITPIRPNTMASPSAIRRRIEASEAPWKTVSTVRTSKPQRSICLMAAVAALRSAGVAAVSEASRWSAGMAPDECSPPSAWAARIRTAASPRAREVQPLRIARAADDVDRRLRLVRVVDGGIGEGLGGVGRLRVARRGAGEPRHEQQQEQTLHQAFF